MPHILVEQDTVGVHLSLQSDLPDEHEHVERADLGQVDRDGAVRDVTGTSTCQQQPCCMCLTSLVCATCVQHSGGVE